MKEPRSRSLRTANLLKQDTQPLGLIGLFRLQLPSFHRVSARRGFTIVELLIVVVVIAILAAITIVSYNGITSSAKESALKSDLNTAAKKLHIEKIETGSFPTTKPAGLPDTIQYSQTNSGQGFCVTTSKEGKAFHTTESGSIQSGACSGHIVAGGGGSGSTEIVANSPIQSVTQAQCQALSVFTGSNNDAVRTVTDNRGGTTRTYEIAKLADGKCWMLTNLKLGSTSSTITLTPTDSNVVSNFTLPQLTTSGSSEYDIPRAYGPVPGDTESGDTNYGYLYNFSAATAGETRATLITGNALYSVCPAGWRLPTGGSVGSDFGQLDVAFGGTGSYAGDSQVNIVKWQPSGLFKMSLSGDWNSGFGGYGYSSSLRSASAHPSFPDSAFGVSVSINPSYVSPGGAYGSRTSGRAVRCLLN